MAELGATLEELRADVTYRGYGTDNLYLDRWINDAQRRILSYKRWPFMLGSMEVPVPAATSYVQPANALIRSIDGIVIREVAPLTERQPLEHLTQQAFHDYVDTSWEIRPGWPEVWTDENGGFRIYPVARTAMTAEVRYAAAAPKLTVISDRTPIPDSHRHVLIAAACVPAAQRQRDWSGLAVAKQEVTDGLAEMSRFYGLMQRQSSHQVGSSRELDHLR